MTDKIWEMTHEFVIPRSEATRNLLFPSRLAKQVSRSR